MAELMLSDAVEYTMSFMYLCCLLSIIWQNIILQFTLLPKNNGRSPSSGISISNIYLTIYVNVFRYIVAVSFISGVLGENHRPAAS